MPYRSLIEGRSVRLVITPSTYRVRLWGRLKEGLGGAIVVTIGGAIVLGLISVLFVATDSHPYQPSHVLFLFGLIVLGPMALFVLLAAPIRALDPSPHEIFLPNELMFKSDAIHVVPREGDPFETSYGFIVGAKLDARGVELSLAHDAPIRVHVSRAAVGPEAFDLIVGWLREHRTL